MSTDKEKVAVIIVIYDPSHKLDFSSFCNVERGIDILLIDNTPDYSHSYSFPENVHYFPLYENKGIAYAQNIGIKWADKNYFEYIFFFDQDSRITPEFIDKMLSEYKRITKIGYKLSVLGPLHINQNTNVIYKVGYGSFTADQMEVPAVISSGSLMKVDTLQIIGYMEDMLFIDYVDFEWCWRAGRKGYNCMITNHVRLPHRVGEKDYNVLSFPIILSSPERYYYQYRNYLLLLKRPYVPLIWKLKQMIKKTFFLVYIPLVSDTPLLIWKNMFKGIKDGIKGLFKSDNHLKTVWK